MNKPYEQHEENSPQDALHRIEAGIGHVVNNLNRTEGPVMHEYKNLRLHYRNSVTWQ